MGLSNTFLGLSCTLSCFSSKAKFSLWPRHVVGDSHPHAAAERGEAVAPPQDMQVQSAADAVVLGGGSDAVMEVRGLPKFVPRGVVNDAGATKWYTEVSWTHREGGHSREYICKLPVAIKESGVHQHNAPVACMGERRLVRLWSDHVDQETAWGGEPGRKARWPTCSSRWRCRTPASGGGGELRDSAESLRSEAPCHTGWRQRRRPTGR